MSYDLEKEERKKDKLDVQKILLYAYGLESCKCPILLDIGFEMNYLKFKTKQRHKQVR